MKNLKSVSALVAALLSTTVFAGGLGLGVGANVGVGAGLGGLGVQGGISQQSDAQIGSGQLGTTARQSIGIQGDAGIDQRTVSEGAAAAAARAAATVQTAPSQNRTNTEVRSNERIGVDSNANANADAELAIRGRQAARQGSHQVHTASHDTVLTAKQVARAQRTEARERRLQSGAVVSGSVRGSEQLQSNTSSGPSVKASVKQAAELYTGG